MFHPDILQQLGQLRELQDRATAARERALHRADEHPAHPGARRLALSLMIALPIALLAARALLLR